jgi:hypothetical protein
MQMLKSRLYEEELRKRQAIKDATNSSKKKIEWGSQIRSYVFHPYKMIKDHRTDFEVGNVQPVMDGELDGFIKAYLMSEKGVAEFLTLIVTIDFTNRFINWRFLYETDFSIYLFKQFVFTCVFAR